MRSHAVMFLAVFVVFLTCNEIGAATENTYLITAMKRITVGQPYNVDLHVINSTGSVRFIVQIIKTWHNNTKMFKIPVSTRRVDAMTGEHKTVTLKIPSTDVKTGRYSLRVRGRRGLVFEKEQSLRLNNKVVSIFIQTDKAIYKPGQIVNFRVVAIYPNLLPYLGSTEIDIDDPNNNKIKHWSHENNSMGVVTHSMQLSSQTVNGNWKISVSLPRFQNQATTKYFMVKQYELPKFEITVDLPSFVLLQDSDVTGTVKSKYTFGKPVKGMAEIRVFIGNIRDSCGNLRRSVIKGFPIDGEQKFRFSMSEVRKLQPYFGDSTRLSLVAYVTEELTGKTLNATAAMMVHRVAEKVLFLDSTPSSFKPGLPFRAYVKVSRQDGTPITAEDAELEVFTCVDYTRTEADQSKYECHTFTGSYSLPFIKLPIPADGIVPIDLEIPDNTTNVKMRAYYKDIYASRHIPQVVSRSKTYMQVKLESDAQSIKAGSIAEFSLLATEVPKEIFYKIISRGKSAISDVVEGNGEKRLKFYINVTATMSPVTTVLVHFIRDNGEIVADSISFKVSDVFENKVSVTFSKDKAEPHTKLDLRVKADQMSQVFLLAVDQSVLLLKSGNDITVTKVLDELKTYDRSSPKVQDWHYPVKSTATNSYDTFKNAGVIALTDIVFTTEQVLVMKYSAGPVGPQARYDSRNAYPAYEGGFVSTGALKEVERVREIFPETWLWTNTTTDSDGMAVIHTTVPDTITSWIASAFAVNSESGLGVTPESAKLTVFRSFFVSLTLPTSIIRGEQVVIQANVFSYLDEHFDATVELEPSEEFQSVLFDDSGKEVLTSEVQRKTVTVISGRPVSVYFPIIPVHLGKIDIQVSARGPLSADAVKRQLLVEPEGVKREVNIPVLIDHTDSSGEFKKILELQTPTSLVPGSERLRITATGDLLGHSIEGLESLLKVPTGCGEQNMLSFTPDVYIADYLKNTKQLTPELENKILTYLELGYQRQLYYQRIDGSFSAFGDRDSAGSTWLTAFVLKSFKEATSYIFIGNSTIDRALHWLLETQNTAGFFNEQGTLLDVNIRNDEGNHIGLTAYVLTALVQYKYHDGFSVKKERIIDATAKALLYLETHSDDVKSNYTLALLAYAFTITGHPFADEVFEKVLERAVTDEGKRHWIHVDESDSTNIYLKEKSGTKSIDVLITSYVLLTYVARHDLTAGNDVMLWITSQRNPHGGFVSSQDTVVALEALTKFAAVARPTNFEIKVKIIAGEKEMDITINDENALVINSYEYEDIPGLLEISSTGKGMAVIEIGLFYNIEKEDWGESSFEVSTVLLDDNINGFTLMTCAKYLGEGQTGMCIQEIQIPSGFVADLSSPGNIAGLKRLEERGSDVVAYFDQIGKTSTCMKLDCSRTSQVAKAQRYYVTVQSYYDPNKIQTVSYQPRKLRDSTVCDFCGDHCEGCSTA